MMIRERDVAVFTEHRLVTDSDSQTDRQAQSHSIYRASCDDFRGIAISPILSKIFEHCILDRFGSFFDTADNQFGFKKGLGCNFTVRAVRNIVESFTKGGSTSNLCAIDLSKAFDKVYHHALYLQELIRR